MFLSFFLYFICLVCIGLFVFAVIQKRRREKPFCRPFYPLIVAILILTFASCCVVIPTGYTGVRSTFGQIDQEVVSSGIRLKLPLVQSVHIVNNKQRDQRFKGDIWGEASDKTVVFATDVIVTYQINPARSAYIYANVSNYTHDLIPQTLVNSSIKSAMIQLPSDQVTNRNKIEPLSKTALNQAVIEKYGADTVLILKVTIDNMDFEENYNKAVEEKQIARQNAEKQAIENQKAIDIAKAAQEKAQIEAETKKIKAQGEADAMVISAEAEAESYRIKSQEITENLLRKWELDARQKHGWVTIQGANAIVTDK